eukprot:GSChrysophyteH1.ASY1.ANO1.2820.1 assembled CDS
MSLNLKVSTLPASKSEYAFLDKAFVSPATFKEVEASAENKYLLVKDDVFLLGYSDAIPNGELCVSLPQRLNAKLQMQPYSCQSFRVEQAPLISAVTLAIDVLKKGDSVARFEIEGSHFTAHVRSLLNAHILKPGQSIPTKYRGKKLSIIVQAVQQGSPGSGVVSSSGLLDSSLSQVELVLAAGGAASGLVLKDGKTRRLEFKSNFNFEEMGIGGLDEQFTSMFRKAFATRMFPGIVSKMGMNHVRGMLLYGPPGCGKTLIARQIARVLDVDEKNIKIVNGPEYKAEGENSSLHIIIFDEMDSIMKVRGQSDNLGVGDNIVNQLLAKIDGVDALNNILVIGMTNRKDMIDPAQILRIKTKKMRDNGMISQECIDRLPELAGMIENFTGAECEAFVSYASKYVLARNIDGTNVTAASQDPKDYILCWEDFMKAIDNHDQYYRHDIVHYGEGFEACWGVVARLLNQVKNSANTPILSVLLEGHAYTGKTAIAASLAFNSGFPYIRMITPDMFIGMNSNDICNKIRSIFLDSYKSKLAIIILDDIERIISYTPVGPRFDVNILQTLMVMIRKPPSSNCGLFVMATTSISHELEDLGLVSAFNVTQHISQLQQADEIRVVLEHISSSGEHSISKSEIADISSAITSPIGIKQLLETLEMAQSEASADGDESSSISVGLFLSCLHVRGF